MSANVLRELPLLMATEIQNVLAPGESIQVSLPGGVGEGIVVTNLRAILMRERDSGSVGGCDLFEYRLRDVNGASIRSELSLIHI